MILTHWLPWTQWSRDERKIRMRELADAGEFHIVLTSALLEAGVAKTAYLRDFLADMREFGLGFTDSHAINGTWADPGMPLAEWKEIVLLRHRMSLQYCARFGVTTMAFHTGNTLNSIYGKNLTFDDYYRSLVRSLEILLPEAEKCGVVIALENQWTPLNHSRHLLRIVGEFDSPNLGLCYDTGHGNLCEKGMNFPGRSCVPKIWNDLGIPVEWEENMIEKFAPRMVNCHLHDNYGVDDEHNLPGDGTVDWTRMLRALRNSPHLQSVQNESNPRGKSVAEAAGVFRRVLAGLL